ncbi:MAG: hypothetical protein HFH35_12505 [Eubacterium sp.]|nr:hypothetical protein [Eubacterium sp.]
MWINSIIVGFVDDCLVRAVEKGGVWMRIGYAMVAFIDRYIFCSITDGDELEADAEADTGMGSSLDSFAQGLSG